MTGEAEIPPGIPHWLLRARRKARLNELCFRNSDGTARVNNWHHTEWFDLAEQHKRLMIEAAREHAKTEIFVFSQPLLEIKNNPNIRILLISDVYEKSKERTRVLKAHITQNADYQAVPGEVRIARSRSDEEFTVARDFFWLKEPTVRSTYAFGPISGGRYDIIIADDLVNWAANSTTPEKRKKLRRWWSDEVLNSVTPDGAIWVIGTRQHHDDLYETIKRDSRFSTFTYPAIDERWVPKNTERGIEGYDQWCLWPEMHDWDTLVSKREADEDSFLRQQQQVAIPDTGLVYRRALVDAAFERGKSVVYDPTAAQYLAIDPGYGQRACMLAIQERSGDEVEVYKEHSFTQLDDDAQCQVILEHCQEVFPEAIFIDAADPGLASAIKRTLRDHGLKIPIQPVPFQKYKKLGIQAIRWLLSTKRIHFGVSSTTIHRPGRTYTDESLFRNEIRDYALKEGEDFEPMKGDDHGPDALCAYGAKWIIPWLRATGQEGTENVVDIMQARKDREDRQARAERRATGLWIRSR